MFTNPAADEGRHVLIQSNSLRGPFANSIVERAMNEIHELMVTVFGPYATDAWIVKSDNPYYTRDGKEVYSSLVMDHRLAKYIQKIMYQAAEHQARTVGDGTTTLFVFYTNLYRRMSDMVSAMSKPYSLTELRNVYNEVVRDVNAAIKRDAVKVDDNLLRSMMYTCMQDAELAAELDKKIHNDLMEQSYVVVEKSNIADDIRVSVHDRPLIKATKIYESVHSESSVIENAGLLFVNGVLDISHPDTLKALGSIAFKGIDVTPSIVIICSGLTESTRRCIKDYSEYCSRVNTNPIYIFSLDNFGSYTKDEVEDIIAYIYDRNETSGLDNSVTFEAHLFQAFVPSTRDKKGDSRAKSLRAQDLAISNLNDLKNAACTLRTVEYIPGDGLFLNSEAGQIAQNRYDALRKSLVEEKSSLKRIEIEKRIRKLFGKFIEVQVGSKLVKDSQRKYELVLDAVVSANTAVEHGVLQTNSIYLAIDIIHELITMAPRYSMESGSHIFRSVIGTIYKALIDTLRDMISNRFPGIEPNKIETAIIASFNQKTPDGDPITERAFDLTRNSLDEVFSTTLPVPTIVTDDGTEISAQIVEPVSMITTLLENSTMILELVCAKAFNLDEFTNNFIS